MTGRVALRIVPTLRSRTPVTPFRATIRCLGNLSHEDPQLPEVGQAARQELPCRSSQGPRLHHQQDQPALQGASGLKVFAPASFVLADSRRASHGSAVFVVLGLVSINLIVRSGRTRSLSCIRNRRICVQSGAKIGRIRLREIS
ncbi:hypothetical protein PHAMO_270150 [Magnetospirillum molischianum DSM 120]|uniref:Uncharacterized protein n=1 Tax=Magnetospirillum molischianum DSM 120 TaxID=1150626 RepID=H8FSH1_MAGML|nr:hypothetical protein PHAMO_270150 [Magnetospirillum molischianum DSM 120]